MLDFLKNFKVGDLVKLKPGVYSPTVIEKYGVGIVVEGYSKHSDNLRIYWVNVNLFDGEPPAGLVKV